MAPFNGNSNSYEAARRQRVEENKKRFEDLGISNLSKSVSDLATAKKKTTQRLPKPNTATTNTIEPRRSCRTRNPIVSYSDEVGLDLPPPRKRFKSSSSSWTTYVARPLNEVKLASYEDRVQALQAAEAFLSTLQSGKPSFAKSMVRSHVYSCFWLGLPTPFCRKYLPKKDLDMTLEDENGAAYDAKYLGSRTGLSGGWRGFALDHKLNDGDAVVFELVESDRFKVYTFRASPALSNQKLAANTVENQRSAENSISRRQKRTASCSGNTWKSKKVEGNESDELSDATEPEHEKELMLENKESVERNGFVADDDHGSIASSEQSSGVIEEENENKDTVAQ